MFKKGEDFYRKIIPSNLKVIHLSQKIYFFIKMICNLISKCFKGIEFNLYQLFYFVS